MKKIAFALTFSILVSLSSHVLVSESQAALRPCTGKEVSVELSYRALIAVEEFYSPKTFEYFFDYLLSAGQEQIPREQKRNQQK
jgi:hypothetical protein